MVLADNVESISEYCHHTNTGCWVPPTLSAIACRASGDNRPDWELPKMAPHRWAWMVANGRATNPLPGSLFQVWRHCETSKCCNPDHLYLVDPDGEESSAEEAEEWLRFVAAEESDVASSDSSQRRGNDAYGSTFAIADSSQVVDRCR